MQIVNSRNVIGAEIRDIDLSKTLSEADFTRVENTFNERGVVCYPGQQLN